MVDHPPLQNHTPWEPIHKLSNAPGRLADMDQGRANTLVLR